MIDQVVAALTRSAASGSRSTALQDLRWFCGMSLAALIGASYFSAPEWALIALASLSGAAFLLALGSFVYLLKTNPDALRSEHFTIEKMRIERGLLGDTSIGFRQAAEESDVLRLPAGQTDDEASGQ